MQMKDISFLKFGNNVKTRNCLSIALSQSNDRLYCAFVSCKCFFFFFPNKPVLKLRTPCKKVFLLLKSVLNHRLLRTVYVHFISLIKLLKSRAVARNTKVRT
jgi:hypothetical protein